MKTSYTFKQTSRGYELSAINSDHQIIINDSHPKYEWMSKLESNRLVNINEQGHFNSSKDYHNAYGGGIQPKQETGVAKPIGPISLTRLDDLNIDDSLFVPMATGSIIDELISTEGGFLPGTNIMLTGQPGTGKTSIGLNLLAELNRQGKKCLFLSCEMNRIDMVRYLKRFPHWGQVPMLFMADYTEGEAKTVIETIINQGWDMVFTDSFSEVCDQVKEDSGWTRTKVEKWFLQLMDQNNVANNDSKTYTTFLTILQSSKGGTFLGGNRTKHMASAMMHLQWEGNENSGRRYVYFSKNRMGQVDKKLYYELGQNGISFDEARYKRDLYNDDLLAEERKALESESDSFDRLFGFDQDGIPAELKTKVVEL